MNFQELEAEIGTFTVPKFQFAQPEMYKTAPNNIKIFFKLQKKVLTPFKVTDVKHQHLK